MHVNMKKWSDRSFQPAVVVRNAVHVFLSHLCYCGQYYITTTLHLDFTFIITVGDKMTIYFEYFSVT